jgi:hypothetical protein
MNNALDIHKSEGMNVAYLQGGNLADGVLGNTGGSAAETISCCGTVEQSEYSFGNPKIFNECFNNVLDKKKQGLGHPCFGHARTRRHQFIQLLSLDQFTTFKTNIKIETYFQDVILERKKKKINSEKKRDVTAVTSVKRKRKMNYSQPIFRMYGNAA